MGFKRLLVFILIIFLLGIFSYFYPQLTCQATNPVKSVEYPLENAILDRVIDGDTIVVTGDTIGNSTHIRMLGINNIEV